MVRLADWESKKYKKGKLERTKLKSKEEVEDSYWVVHKRAYYRDLTDEEWKAKIIKILPDELTKLPETLEEFQDLYFYWEPSRNIKYVDEGLRKFLKLAMWNARKIKGKYPTYREVERIDELFEGHRWISWKDSDNPEDPSLTDGFNDYGRRG